jgi:hypothetical protein
MSNVLDTKPAQESGASCRTVRADPSCETEASKREPPQIDRVDGNFLIDAALIGELFDIPAAEVPALMRSKSITSVCEHGIDADEGLFRLNFFHGGRHARLRVDAAGRILHRSMIDFGGRSQRQGRRAQPKSTVRTASFSSTR